VRRRKRKRKTELHNRGEWGRNTTGEERRERFGKSSWEKGVYADGDRAHRICAKDEKRKQRNLSNN